MFAEVVSHLRRVVECGGEAVPAAHLRVECGGQAVPAAHLRAEILKSLHPLPAALLQKAILRTIQKQVRPLDHGVLYTV